MFVGLWKEGKKHGKGYYLWPNGAKYHIMYTEGVKRQELGKLESSQVSLEDLKKTYSNVSKRATNVRKLL